MQDKDLFLQEFADVKPLEQDKAELGRAPVERDFEQIRQAAVKEDQTLSDLSDAIEYLDQNAIVGFKRPGIQEGVYKKLRLGKYESQTRFDMHGMTVAQARIAVVQLIEDCMAHDVRVLTIVHGKGLRSKEGVAHLKSHLVHWLKQIRVVQAFHSAQVAHGGQGALYVLLQKSEAAKQQNRDVHRGRGDG